MTHQTKGFGLKVDAHVDGHIPHQVLVGVEKDVSRRVLDLENIASINKGLPGDQGRDACNTVVVSTTSKLPAASLYHSTHVRYDSALSLG